MAAIPVRRGTRGARGGSFRPFAGAALAGNEAGMLLEAPGRDSAVADAGAGEAARAGKECGKARVNPPAAGEKNRGTGLPADGLRLPREASRAAVPPMDVAGGIFRAVPDAGRRAS